MRFFNFYVAYMVQKYQNESAPIFYYGKSPKTSRKHLKIPYLQALTLGRVIKMTLYISRKNKILYCNTTTWRGKVVFTWPCLCPGRCWTCWPSSCACSCRSSRASCSSSPAWWCSTDPRTSSAPAAAASATWTGSAASSGLRWGEVLNRDIFIIWLLLWLFTIACLEYTSKRMPLLNMGLPRFLVSS